MVCFVVSLLDHNLTTSLVHQPGVSSQPQRPLMRQKLCLPRSEDTLQPM
jgi:hypothetical protein